MQSKYLLTAAVITFSCSGPDQAKEEKMPNILWITCEDMSPHLGCYGDERVRTPNLDNLANESIRFTNAYSVSGVCAPSRAALITGMYPTSFGAMHMRTVSRTASIDKVTDPEALAIPVYEAVPPAGVKCFPEYLREKGYYCSNNKKTDYQFHPPISAWDESSENAHWRNRPEEDMPFFSVFNITTTHESQIWARAGDSLLYDPGEMTVPPYYPDTEVVRKDLARMYTNISLMDQQAGELIRQLKEDGLYENTIIFFYSDHGDGTPRAKRWLYDSGLKVPLLVRFPGGEGAGTISDRMVSFVDFAPTILSLTGIPIPAYMEGFAFLGEQNASPRKYVYAAKDRMDPALDRARAVRDKRFKYIRNYRPEKPFVQFIPYRDQMPLMQELLKFHEEGRLDSVQSLWFRKNKPAEELYDLKNDPYEINNLAGDARYQGELERLRKAHEEWMEQYGDLGDLPEPELVKLLWPPDGKQPLTEPAEYRIVNDSLYLSCETEGASIVYQTPSDTLDGKSHWKLYTAPVAMKEKPFAARSCRIGYQPGEFVQILED